MAQTLCAFGCKVEVKNKVSIFYTWLLNVEGTLKLVERLDKAQQCRNYKVCSKSSMNGAIVQQPQWLGCCTHTQTHQWETCQLVSSTIKTTTKGGGAPCEKSNAVSVRRRVIAKWNNAWTSSFASKSNWHIYTVPKPAIANNTKPQQ